MSLLHRHNEANLDGEDCEWKIYVSREEAL